MNDAVRSSAHPGLHSHGGMDPVLERVAITGTVRPTLAFIRVRQEYRNAGRENIEAVYTFPLPPQATLLDVVAELDGKRYRGTVLPKAEAEAKYEGAVAEGDTVLMVERPEPGLFTMNLGNLMAGESASVEIEYAMLLDWHGRRMRLSLPMTIAPRYGEEKSKLAPHQKPPVDALLERPFNLSLRLIGDLARASIASPTHAVSTRTAEDGVEVTLQRESAWMDRDFVLTAETRAAPAPSLVAADSEEGTVLCGSFQLPPAETVAPARDVKVILDCSGSMGGGSIWLARMGVLRLLDGLRPADRVGVVAFGSTAIAFASSMLEATESNLEAAKAWVRERNADMGGTEMAAAFEAALAIRGANKACDIFLLTDGEIGRTEELLRKVRASGHRVFVVGIGSSPQQGLLADLASQTGGAAEWVTPNEDLPEVIRRLFSRLVERAVLTLDIRCEGGFRWLSRSPSLSAFSGDTIHFFGSAGGRTGTVSVAWELEGGAKGHLDLPGHESAQGAEEESLVRVAANWRVRDLLLAKPRRAKEAAAIALRHQLVTSETNYLLVIDRGEGRATQLPELAQVPHMLAAGWGAAGSVGMDLGSIDSLCLDSDFTASPGSAMRDVAAKLSGTVRHMKDLDVLAEQRQKAESFRHFLRNANKEHGALLRTIPLSFAFAELHRLGLDPGIINELAALVDQRTSEEEVVRALWAVLLARAVELKLARGLQRAIHQAGAPAKVDPALVACVEEQLSRLGLFDAPMPARR